MKVTLRVLLLILLIPVLLVIAAVKMITGMAASIK